MSSGIKDFIDAVRTENEEPTKVYEAIVSGVDDEGIVWVNIAGSDKETPTASTSTEVKTGDIVNVEWRNNKLYIAGNYSNPSAGSQRVDIIENTANKAVQDAQRASVAALSAETSAEQAQASASTAQTAAQQAVTDAAAASSAAATADTKAVQAKTAADNAQASAENASEYAARALGNLSTVQSVSETLTWITQHGTMSLTSDQQLDPTHVYFVVDANGDYVVGSTHYSVVTEPDVDDIGTYYELTIDESLNNYVGTHLALDSEGLWLLPASSGTNKVLIATGSGSTHTTAGTYLIDSSGNTAASFRSDGATMSAQGVQIIHLGYGPGQNEQGGTSNAPYFNLGIRKSNTTIGNDSCVIGSQNQAGGFAAVAMGSQNKAEGTYSVAEGQLTESLNNYTHTEGFMSRATQTGGHAEGYACTSSGQFAHSEGAQCVASGDCSHAHGNGAKAGSDNQTAIGKYNIEDVNDVYGLILGNGSSGSSRSNALTVKWNGDVKSSGDIEDGSGNVLADKADSSSLATVATSGSYNDLSNQPAIPTKTSDLTNDSGFITTETDPTVPSWAKASTKPTYTASEVGALPDTTTIPTKTSDLNNDSGFVSGTGFFKIVELQITNTAQISAHGYQTGATYTVPAASRPSRMVLAGIVGYSASNFRLVPSTHYVNGNHTIFANMANMSATAVSAGATITFRLLYIKATSA